MAHNEVVMNAVWWLVVTPMTKRYFESVFLAVLPVCVAEDVVFLATAISDVAVAKEAFFVVVGE